MFMRIQALTLTELLITLVLISVIIFALSNIDVFSRFQVTSADRRAKVQNEASLVLEHIAKRLSQAAGNEMLTGPNTVIYTVENDSPAGDDDNNRLNFFSGSQDAGYWRGYRYRNTGQNKNQILYCDSCTSSTCDTCSVIATNIVGFMPFKPNDAGGRLNTNAIPVSVRACWDASGTSGALGSAENPCVTLNTRLVMPMVSTN